MGIPMSCFGFATGYFLCVNSGRPVPCLVENQNETGCSSVNCICLVCAVSSSNMMQMIMDAMYHSTSKRRSILICFLSVSFFKMSTIWFIGIISTISSRQICFSPAEKYWNSVHLPGITERWANIYRSNLLPNRVNLIR